MIKGAKEGFLSDRRRSGAESVAVVALLWVALAKLGLQLFLFASLSVAARLGKSDWRVIVAAV